LKGVWKRVSDSRKGFNEESAQELFLPAFTEGTRSKSKSRKHLRKKEKSPQELSLL